MQYEILLIVPQDKSMILRYETVSQARLALDNIEKYRPNYNGFEVTATPLNFQAKPKS